MVFGVRVRGQAEVVEGVAASAVKRLRPLNRLKEKKDEQRDYQETLAERVGEGGGDWKRRRKCPHFSFSQI